MRTKKKTFEPKELQVVLVFDLELWNTTTDKVKMATILPRIQTLCDDHSSVILSVAYGLAQGNPNDWKHEPFMTYVKSSIHVQPENLKRSLQSSLDQQAYPFRKVPMPGEDEAIQLTFVGRNAIEALTQRKQKSAARLAS